MTAIKAPTQKKINDHREKQQNSMDKAMEEIYFAMYQSNQAISNELNKTKAVVAKIVEKSLDVDNVKEEDFKQEDFDKLIPVFGFLFYNTKTDGFVKITPINAGWNLEEPKEGSPLVFTFSSLVPNDQYPTTFTATSTNIEEATMELRKMLFDYYESRKIQTTV